MSNKFVPRIYIIGELYETAVVEHNKSKVHYLRSVMKLNVGEQVFLFNENNGEYLAKIITLSKSIVEFDVLHRVRNPYFGYDITLLNAPIHKDNFRFVVEKGTELGVRKFRPVITERTNAPKVRIDKAREHIMGSVEQCKRLDIPEINHEEKLSTVMRRWDKNIPIIYCCERGGKNINDITTEISNKPIAILVGPEGGFSDDEHKWLSKQEHIYSISLGPRIMRSETASIAVLSALQATIGDWCDSINYIG